MGVEPARAADPRNLTVPFRIRARREPGVQALGAVDAPQVPTVVGVVEPYFSSPSRKAIPSVASRLRCHCLKPGVALA